MNAPLMTLKDIHLGIGSDDLFRDASLSIFDGDALCLVGRNGAGKSTFLKVINGEIEPDGGERVLRSGLEIATLPQNPDFSTFSTLYDYARHGFDAENEYKVEGAFDAMKIARNLSTEAASGGEKRRAALARFLAVDADLWLLDEPTNHLDISAIEWLETMIRGFRGAFILISHDRRFLANLTKGTIWLDRGTVRRREIGYRDFEDWRDDFYAKEIAQWRKEDAFIDEEARWAIEGISARRKRNQGRLRRLDSMRGEQDARIKHARTPELHLGDSERSGKLIVELKNVSKSYDKPILKEFSLKITRGESVAIVGPNGAGKSTLIRMILGLESADSGSIREGLNLNVAYFDQARAKFDDNKTLWEALTEDPELSVSGRSDQVMVRGQPRHVVAYLKAFLFTPAQAKSPIGTLSGGERARLLLAKIMAEESNVLVLDEPTNDLDVETLDLLQEVLLDYSGTIILVSHDRDFVDRIAKRTILMDGLGHCEIYAGGWSDLVAQRGTTGFLPSDYQKSVKKRKAREKDAREKADEIAKKLSFKDAHRLEILPAEIDRTEKEISKLETLLSDGSLYEREPIKFEKASKMLAERKDQLVLFENEWLELEEKRIEIEGE